METVKEELVKKLEAKGISVEQAAKAIEFDPCILGLYFAKDGYPMPKRIMDKLTNIVLN